MTESLIAGILNGGISAGATNYAPIGNGKLNSSSTETNYQTTWRSGGTFSNLYCRISANATSSGSNLRYRVGTANGNQNVSIGSGATGEFTDAANSDVVSAGNIIDYAIINGGGGTLTVQGITEYFIPTTTSNTLTKFTCTGSPADTSVNTTYYEPLGGALVFASNNSTEANAQFTNKIAATLKNLFVRVSANTASIATVKSRVNTANGAMSVSITTGATGVFEDTTNSDTLQVGDLVCYAVNSTVTTTFTMRIIAADYLTTTGYAHFISGDASAASTIAKSTTTNIGIGQGTTADSTELDVKIKAQIPFTGTFLEAYVVANTVSATSTVKVRKNGANGNQNLSIGSNTTGAFIDTTNNDVFVTTDEVNYQVVTGGTGTSMAFGSIGMLALFQGSPYTLTAATNAFSLTGNAATLAEAHKLVAATGSISVSGNAATLAEAHKLVAATGTISVSGNAATLAEAHKLVAATGTISVSGNAATMAEGHDLIAAKGTFSLTGNAVTLSNGPVLSAVKGSYSVTGNSAILSEGRNLVAAKGAIIITGNAAVLAEGRNDIAANGAYVVAGYDITMTKGGATAKSVNANYSALRRYRNIPRETERDWHEVEEERKRIFNELMAETLNPIKEIDYHEPFVPDTVYIPDAMEKAIRYRRIKDAQMTAVLLAA